MNKLMLNRFNNDVYLVLTDQGEHVGNLKLTGGVWQFKAIGCNPKSDVIGGGGSLPDRHNHLRGCRPSADQRQPRPE